MEELTPGQYSGPADLGPVSLRQYELVYSILARKQEFLVNFPALSHRNYESTRDLNS